MSRFWPLMSGLTEATFQSSRNVPIVRDWLTMVVMASKIVSLNFSRNQVLQGSMIQVVGLIFLMMLSISSFSRGPKLVNLYISYGRTSVYLGHETVLWFFIFYLGRNLQMCLVGQMEIQWLAMGFHPLILLMIWAICRGF